MEVEVAMAGLENGSVLWLSASKTVLPRRLWHMSMIWKHDCTLEGRRENFGWSWRNKTSFLRSIHWS